MKRVLIIFFLVALLFGCGKDPDDVIDDPEDIKELMGADLIGDHIEWYGRHHLNQDRVTFYHTATGFKVRFFGRVIDMDLALETYKRDVWFSVSKDEEDLLESETFVLDQTSKTLRITFDTYDDHVVQVIKRSEPEDGVTSLVIVSTNGYLKPSTDDSTAPHFLIIGASGISGHGALGVEGQPRTTANSSSLHAFGYLSAKAFDGTFEFVANSGWGLAFGFNDPTGEQNIFKAYDSVGIDADERIVDAPFTNRVTPDLVIVNIGGNDYSAVINKLQGFEKNDAILTFKQTVADFILKIREDAPQAHIIWTMTEGSLNGTAAMAVIATLDETDQAFVHVVNILKVGEDGDPEGANHHAHYVTHQKSANRIIDLIHTFWD
ncbi:MAG: hypothetical protein K9K93_05510 [Acholeplasmataceae bacterium]|nr:hypothetical protein [Acholeplasmataceae bacterium]